MEQTDFSAKGRRMALLACEQGALPTAVGNRQ